MTALLPSLAASVFWICALLIVYTYALYPLVLFALYTGSQIRRDLGYLFRRRTRRVPIPSGDQWPTVTIVVAAYDEEASLPAKLENLRAIGYPEDRLQVVIVSDGSSDGTNDLLKNASGIRAILLPERAGKPNALCHGVAAATGEILVFSDASTVFAANTVCQLVRHFADPTVGAVCGSLNFEASSESEQTEGVYWRYESALRLMEARIGATLTASGAVYALRRRCWLAISRDTVIEDFVIPMNARRLGYRVLYDPEAVATDVAAESVAGEFTRRVRLAVGSFRALPQLLRVPINLATGFAFISHKLLRWIIPFLAIAAFATNVVLLWRGLVYQIAFGLQMLLYIWAAMGWLFRARLHRVRYAKLAYFIVAMHAAFIVGLLRTLRRSQEVRWERVS